MGAKYRVLAFIDSYLPGEKGGGPIQSLESLVRGVGSEFIFTIVTRDRDLGDSRPYDGVKNGSLRNIGGAQVLYLKYDLFHVLYMFRLISTAKYDLLYLNSFFSRRSSILPFLLWRLGFAQSVPILIAPRGELSAGALSIKRKRKTLYLFLAKQLGLYSRAHWAASSNLEREEIRRVMRPGRATDTKPDTRNEAIYVARDMAAAETIRFMPKAIARREKTVGRAKIVFISRITRKKNLDFALDVISAARGFIEMEIFGPIEDKEYWRECCAKIDRLPKNIAAIYRGTVHHKNVAEIMYNSDLFLFPTLGENYGHVIVEALVNGCPVIISDRTPWRELNSKGVGFDISLDAKDDFVRAVQTIVDMDNQCFQAFSLKVRDFGNSILDDGRVLSENRRILASLIGGDK
jgi:glycosyltransferase involved in cell wall biosynthesis